MNKRSIDIRNIGRVEYSEALAMQRAVFDRLLATKSVGSASGSSTPWSVEASADTPYSADSASGSSIPVPESSLIATCLSEPKEAAPQVLFFVEHPHVYTLGKSGDHSNLLINDDFLSKIGASYFKTDRGGDVTYHGIGQLVGYPILDLEQQEMSLKDYIWALEECVIETVAEYGIVGTRMDGATGVWIDVGTARARKISAIGVKASRFVTMHGFALNVTTDLSYFSHINPCGFTDKGVTSIEKESGFKPSLDEVASRFTTHFKRRFEGAEDRK